MAAFAFASNVTNGFYGKKWWCLYLMQMQTLGPIYTKHPRQRCDNCAMTLAILFLLKTLESLQNGVATYFQATPLFSMRTELQASSQSCRSGDADAQCKSAFKCEQGLRVYSH